MEITIDSKHLKSETEIQAEQKRHIKLLGSVRKVPGLTMFEYNPQTKELKPAHYNEVQVGWKKEVRYKLVVDEVCTYVQALNTRNALKKLQRARL